MTTKKTSTRSDKAAAPSSTTPPSEPATADATAPAKAAKGPRVAAKAAKTAPEPPAVDEFGGLIGVGNARTIRAPWRTSSVARVRAAVVADSEARGVDDETVDEIAVVVSELVSNALRHAKPLHDNTVRVHWTERNGVVEVEVTDGGGHTSPKPRPQAVFAVSGRGLRIVRSFAHEWGVTEKKDGVTVWASLGGPSRRRA